MNESPNEYPHCRDEDPPSRLDERRYDVGILTDRLEAMFSSPPGPDSGSVL